ncbi:MAG: hypothetical protein ND895_24340 [Pyrinomonadaceae bacterium]|nr:hypothetical protein [Pyrinomonadaceae bacterium]
MDDSLGNLWTASADTRTALVVGHPGHELLVHGWLEVTRPLVFVFTDGSGRSNQSRLASTTKVLNQTGATPGCIYGRLTDAEGYAAILNHDFDLFVGLARELCAALVAEQVEYVAGDAFEGYNPMHDVCRLVINSAVAVARRERGQRLGNFEFSLVGQPDAYCERPNTNGTWRELDEAAFARKMTAAKGYAQLAGEVYAALERTTADAFRVERLYSVDSSAGDNHCDDPPFYEQYGEKQVAAGHYQRVLRYYEHIAPLAEALRRYVESSI